MKRLSRSALVVSVAGALLAASCGIGEVDAPITIRSDNRLEIVEPQDGDRVELPVTVRWTSRDFELVGGRRFVLMVDQIPLKPGEELRLQLCTRGDDRPIQPGSLRKPCYDDRERVILTTQTSHTFDCIKPRRGVSKRQRNVHTVAVIYLNEKGERVSTAGHSVEFEILENRRLQECSL